jgi:hypothetical protein
MTASFSKGLFARRQFANNASRRRQPHLKLAAGRLGVAQQRPGARKRVAVFEPGDGGLAGAHPDRKFGLAEARTQASPEQLGGNLELRRQCVILGLDPGVSEQTGLKLFEGDRHVMLDR